MSGYRIEPIRAEHLGAIAEIEQSCFAEPWSESALGLLLSDMGTGLVCLYGEEVVAYVGMLLAPDEGQITNVAVRSDHRRKGLGGRLMEALARLAWESGLRHIALEVRVSNAAAIALYENAGYVTAGRRPHFYRHPREDALVMIKSLE